MTDITLIKMEDRYTLWQNCTDKEREQLLSTIRHERTQTKSNKGKVRAKRNSAKREDNLLALFNELSPEEQAAFLEQHEDEK